MCSKGAQVTSLGGSNWKPLTKCKLFNFLQGHVFLELELEKYILNFYVAHFVKDIGDKSNFDMAMAFLKASLIKPE